MDILSLLRGSPGAQAWMAQQGPALGALGISPREQLDREMSYDGSHPRQQEQEAINAFRGYGPQMLMDAFIPGYGAGGDAKAASKAYGEGRYGAAAGNALMAAMDFVPVLGALPAAAKGIRAFHGGGGDVAKAAGDRGAWFSEARDLADEYAFGGGSVREAEITPNKPISFVHAEQRRPIGDLISTALEGAGDLSDEAISRVRPIIDRLNARYAGENKPLFEYWNNDRDVADLFRALGYDSISVAEKSGGPKTWAALDPAIISAPAPKGIRAFHGSPHDFDRFDMSKIGTGEGAQAYGHGLYFAENERVAQGYRDDLSQMNFSSAKRALDNFGGDADAAIQSARDKIARLSELPPSDRRTAQIGINEQKIANLTRYKETGDMGLGRMYEVNINADPEAFLDWDKPLNPDNPLLANVPLDLSTRAAINRGEPQSVDLLLRGVEAKTQRPASEALRDAGIPGIKYLDAGSRGAGDGSRNYVVFDDRLITILRKYGIGGLIAGGGAYALTDAEYAQAAELLAQDGMNTGAQ